MHRLISLPGLQVHIHSLEGKLSCRLETQGKPVVSFELAEANIEELDRQTPQGAGRTTSGTHISAVGLSLTLVKNNGALDMEYEGREGATAHWKFDALEETSRVAGLYASAGTQTLMATLSVKIRASNDPRLITTACEAALRAEGATITLLICQGRDGTTWEVKPDGEGRRQINSRLESDIGVASPPDTSVQTRSSTRKRARTENHTSNKMSDSLPRYFYLRGTGIRHPLNRRHRKHGLWRIDRKTNEFSFAISTDALYAEDIMPDPSKWEHYQGTMRLHIRQNDKPNFTSSHDPYETPYGDNDGSLMFTQAIDINDFLAALHKCLLPDRQGRK